MNDNIKIERKNQFKPGEVTNPNGRPIGIPNKVNAIMREKVVTILENNWEKIQEDINSLDPKDRLSFLERLMSYAIPKLQLVKSETTVHYTGAENLSSTELTQFILQIGTTNGDQPETE